MKNNTCSNNIDFGIYDEYGSSELIQNNTCNYNEEIGIYSECGSKFIDNKCMSNKWGIYIYHGSYLNVSNNYCANNVWGIYVMIYYPSTISSNYCTSNTFGLLVGGSCHYSSYIENNYCISNKEYGISLNGLFCYRYYPGNEIKNNR